MGLACAEFERVLVMVTFRFCSAVQPIPAPKGRGSPSPGQRPGEPCRNTNAVGPTGQRFSLQSQNWVVQPMIVVLGRRPRKLPTSGIGWPVGPRNARRWAYGSPGRCPRCTTHVKDPSGLVPLVNKVGWLRQASAKTTDPHVLVTWVKKIGGHAQAGESHSPSGRAGRGLDAHSVSVVAFQPRSPAGQAGRGLTRLV